MTKVFKLNSAFQPSGDQPEAIRRLEEGLEDGLAHQTLLGVTGSGKTFTVANVIADLNRPTMVLVSHDPDVIDHMCDRAVRMDRGRITG